MSTLSTRLQNPLPEEAIERTSGRETGKGYDTTGYGYQYIIDRLNDACGFEGWKYDWEIVSDLAGQWSSGKPYYELTVRVMIAVQVGDTWVERACAGGHRADLHGDALKGAITNGFKKTAAFFGIGASAYRGTIDDDNRPMGGEQPAGRSQGATASTKQFNFISSLLENEVFDDDERADYGAKAYDFTQQETFQRDGTAVSGKQLASQMIEFLQQQIEERS